MDKQDRLILMIDDHPLFRVGLRATLLSTGLPVRVEEAASVAAALDALAANPPFDLILYDWHLASGGGVKGLLAVLQCAPQAPVLVISASEDEAVKVAALALGAVDFVSKAADPRRMRDVLRRWLAHGTVPAAGPHPSPGQPAWPARSAQPALVAALTLRQHQVLRLMACGNANKTIADELHIAEATVRAHVSDILRLLDVHNRTEAVVMATRYGLV